MIFNNTLKLLVLISTLILSASSAEKRDYVTTSIATHLTTQPGGAVITIQTATIFTVTEDATTPTTTSTTIAAVDTTPTTSSTTITTKAAAVTTAAANTDAIGITTSGEFLGIATSTTRKSSGTKSGQTENYTGPRQNPSTTMTPLPTGAVTTLTIESYQTITMADTTYTTTRAKTSMYVTLTVQSIVEVIQTTFAQRFKTMYSSTFSGSSGSIGLGTLSGEIGKVRTSYSYTEEGSNNAVINSNNWGLLGMLLSFLYMFI